MIDLIWLTIALPLIGVLINGFFGRRLNRELNGMIGSGTVVLAFLIGFIIAVQAPENGQSVVLWDWAVIGSLEIQVSFLVDSLSMMMVLIITGVGSLIHIYAIGYMDHDKDVARFFTYLNLFVASMLLLVLSDNYVGLFAGWELVGVCSYLLIGFWYQKDSAADAGKKAFIVNRIGDVGFALGIFLIWTTFGSVNYTEVFHAVEASYLANHDAHNPHFRVYCWFIVSLELWGRVLKSPSIFGCQMQWKGLPRFQPSFTPQPWSPLACI